MVERIATYELLSIFRKLYGVGFAAEHGYDTLNWVTVTVQGYVTVTVQ